MEGLTSDSDSAATAAVTRYDTDFTKSHEPDVCQGHTDLHMVCLHNSLATVAPDVAQYWNHSKNEKAPQQVLAGSRLRSEWKCPTCEWEWQALIAGRVIQRLVAPNAVWR